MNKNMSLRQQVSSLVDRQVYWQVSDRVFRQVRDQVSRQVSSLADRQVYWQVYRQVCEQLNEQ